MPRGPHDDEIDENDLDKDHARQRLEEFLRQREPNSPPAERQHEGDGADEPQNPGQSRPPNSEP